MPNLKELMVSLSEFKKQASDIINSKLTKVIVKNNEPVSVIMPYGDYLALTEDVEDVQRMMRATGEEITLSNGVKIMVLVETDNENIIIKTYTKMKTSGEYKPYFTHYLSNPSVTQTLTTEELTEHYQSGNKEG